MKAISLPLNILVIVAIAVVVLLGLIAMYFTGFGPFTTTVSLEGVKNAACVELVQQNRCRGGTREVHIQDFDANKNGAFVAWRDWSWTWTDDEKCGPTARSHDNLASLCGCYLNIDSENDCRALCGCPAV